MKKAVRILTLLCLVVMCMSITAGAATKNGWIKKSNRYYYYENGKKVKGLKEINGKTYYFGKKGRQQYSWRKVGDNFYCFNAGYQTDGYMLKSTTKNGITLKKSGKAVISSERAQKKLEMMVRVSELMDTITKSKAYTQSKKLKLCYDYLRRNIPYRSASTLRLYDPDRDIYYVNLLLDNGYADCHPYAFTFAYLANALGYESIKVISADNAKVNGTKPHSYVRIGKKYYDPSLGRNPNFGANVLKKYTFYEVKSKKFKKYMKRYGHTKTVAKVYLNKL